MTTALVGGLLKLSISSKTDYGVALQKAEEPYTSYTVIDFFFMQEFSIEEKIEKKMGKELGYTFGKRQTKEPFPKGRAPEDP